MNLRSFRFDSKYKILYAGDDDINLAAIYLGAILYNLGYSFDYIPSYEKFNFNSLEELNYDLIILSDYPALNFSESQLNLLKEFVLSGKNLLMIGGWESFTGLNIEYKNTDIESVLPVTLKDSDDRVNAGQGILVNLINDNFFRNLDWSMPPIIVGFNQFYPKEDAVTVLEGSKIYIINNVLELKEEYPLLVFSDVYGGRSTALAFDLAPHWIGCMVDWGDKRRRIDFIDGTFIEIGNYYFEFVKELINIAIKGVSNEG